MRFRIILLAFTIAFNLELFSQNPHWSWSKSVYGISSEFANSIAVDTLGNVYIAGNAAVDTIHFGNNNSYNDVDIFLAKYNYLGKLIWAKKFNGINASVSAITIDKEGNIYMTGDFTDDFYIDSTLLTSTTKNAFIAKFNTNGNLIWADKSTSTIYDCRGYNLIIDKSDNVYMIGIFQSYHISFGNITLTFPFSAAGSGDAIFIVKYNKSGNILWAKSFSGDISSALYSGVCDNFNNLYLSGCFDSFNLQVGAVTLSNYSPYINDICLIKLDSLGNVRWAKNAGGNNDDLGTGIALDNSNNVYMTGIFKSPVCHFDTIDLLNTGNYDIFICKYDSGGNIKWVKGINGSQYDVGLSLCQNIFDNFSILGYYESPSLSFGIDTIQNEGARDIFIAEFDSLGNWNWSKDLGGNSNDVARKIISDNFGNSYIVGYFSSYSIGFGCDTLINFNSNGTYDAFFAKLSNCGISQPVITASGSIPFCYGDSVLLSTSSASNYLWSTNETTQSIYVFTSGAYSVTVSDSLQCIASACPIDINILAAPDVPIISQFGDSLESTNGVSYQWYLNDSILINDTLQYIVPNVPGSYKVIITDSLGCSSKSIPFLFSNVDIVSLFELNPLVVLPNPSTGEFFVNNAAAIEEIQISNSFGQIVQKFRIDKQSSIYFRLSEPGVYFVRIITAKQAATKKIIVNN